MKTPVSTLANTSVSAPVKEPGSILVSTIVSTPAKTPVSILVNTIVRIPVSTLSVSVNSSADAAVSLSESTRVIQLVHLSIAAFCVYVLS